MTETASPHRAGARFRRLRPDDTPRYRAIMLDAYTRHGDAFTSTAAEREALPLKWWADRLEDAEDASQWVLGAFQLEDLVGVIGLAFSTRHKEAHKAKLFGMYVDPRARRLGLGRELVNRALNYARTRAGLRVVQLTVTDGNRCAQSVYERGGFVVFGAEPLAVARGSDFAAKVHMWCDLKRRDR